MGWVRRVRHRSGESSWQARWRDPTGAERAKNFDRKIDAQRYLVGLQSDILRGSYTDPRLGQTKLEEWIAEWQPTRTNLSPATRLRDEASIRNHVLPALGAVPIAHLRPVHVAQWVSALDAQGLAPATVRKAYQLLAASLSAAVDNGVIAITPCRKVKLPKLEQPDMRILDPDEIEQLAGAIDPRYRAMVLTAAYTGLRFGELAALRIERFDALRRSIRVVESLSEVRGTFHFKPPKSDAWRRTVSVPRIPGRRARRAPRQVRRRLWIGVHRPGRRTHQAHQLPPPNVGARRSRLGRPARAPSTTCDILTPRSSSPRASTPR